MTITLSLPLPPSVNNLFVNRKDGKGRFTSPRYAAWKKAAGLELLVQRPGRVWGNYEVNITFPKTRADGDNLVKPILDLLVTHQITDDDAKCQDCRWVKSGQPGSVSVTIKPRGEIG
jgi:Holliday junction resolvase RusA-like endonuclease